MVALMAATVVVILSNSNMASSLMAFLAMVPQWVTELNLTMVAPLVMAHQVVMVVTAAPLVMAVAV